MPFTRAGAGFAPTNFPSYGLLLARGRERDFGSGNNDTWFLPSGSTAWSQLTPVTSPPGFNGSGMATDPSTGTPPLFIGRQTGSGDLNQTWRWTQ